MLLRRDIWAELGIKFTVICQCCQDFVKIVSLAPATVALYTAAGSADPSLSDWLQISSGLYLMLVLLSGAANHAKGVMVLSPLHM